MPALLNCAVAHVATGKILDARDPKALTDSIPWHGPVTDFGQLLNTTTPATSFSHGLTGVNQVGNYTFTDAIVLSFINLLAIVLAYRICKRATAHLRLLYTMDVERDQRYWTVSHSRVWSWFRRHLLLAPLIRHLHHDQIRFSKTLSIGTLPSRIQTIIIVSYIFSNVAYALALDWSRPDSFSVVAELRGRLGSLAAINLIPTILFALRNNPLGSLLAIPYDTFNLLHRWCARIVIVEAVMHTICWAWNDMHSGGQRQIQLTLATSSSYQGGMIAMCSFALIFLAAFNPIRHAFYETFLTLHRSLALMALIGVNVHLGKANLPQLPFVQLAFAFWMTEWICRSLRLTYYNMSRKHGCTQVVVEALPAEACRVTFHLRKPLRWSPGSHAHVYLPAISWLSSHPFSIAWVDQQSRNNLYLSESASTPNTVLGEESTYKESAYISASVGTNASYQHSVQGISVSLIVSARRGMTRRIYEKAFTSPNRSFTTWGAIEGSYGGHESLDSYGTVILFAGGVGITHCIGYVQRLLQHRCAGIASTQKILLVWSVPRAEALEWVRPWMEQILQLPGRREVLRIEVFITRPRHSREVVSPAGSVRLFPGRCNPQVVVEREMQKRIGAMAIVVCGPGALADSVRAAVRGIVEEAAVDLIEEAFTY